MRNKEDLNQYSTSQIKLPQGRVEGELAKTTGSTAKTVGSMVLKALKTAFFTLMFAGILVFIAVLSYILKFKDDPPPDISTVSLNKDSVVYTQNEAGDWVKSLTFHSADAQRTIVYYDQIPKHVIDALISIEDKRFWEHNGVDLRTTGNAVLHLFGGDGRGGSTITQQLIKNVTQQNQNSIMRKVKEIFLAINLEKKYSKEEILQSYLNVVNFGGNYQGVQAAAKAYFGKSISDCSIAEGAAIVGITQYPYKYNPLINPENNRERRNIVIKQMYEQGRITEQEYNQAKQESANMVFNTGSDDDTQSSATSDLDWYDEVMYNEVIRDIMQLKSYSASMAENYLKTGGLQIYSAKNTAVQRGVQNLVLNEDILPYDPEVNFSIYVMDFTGKTIAVVGGRGQKTSDLIFNLATQGVKQPGSSIKPLTSYLNGIDKNYVNYSTMIDDSPIPNYFDDGDAGPKNYDREYLGKMTVSRAFADSRNTASVKILDMVGLDNAYNFLKNQLHFKSVTPDDIGRSALALGGLTYGATAQEMAAAFQIFGNGGTYNKPYTYYYIKDDNDGSYILDNRNAMGEKVLSTETAGIMNKLLHEPIENSWGSATMLRGMTTKDGEALDIWGKTGTTEEQQNIWFVGGTDQFVSAIWNGYADRYARLDDSTTAKTMWKAVTQYLSDNFVFTDTGYMVTDNIVEKRYCKDSGLIAGAKCTDTALGWYTSDTIPDTCDGGKDHVTGKNVATPTPTPTPSATPTPIPTQTPIPTATPTPEQTPPPESTPPPSSSPSPEQPSQPSNPSVPIDEPKVPINQPAG